LNFNFLKKSIYMKRFSGFVTKPWFFLLVIFFVSLVTFGFRMGAMGFYWDDWLAIFMGRTHNTSLLWQYYAYDRPISIWTYLLTFPIFGLHPALWQLFTISLRWLTGVGFWWALRGIWPERLREISWMTILFVLYPGFTQQSISVAYSQHFICYALYTLSLALMVWSIRKPRWYWPFTILGFLSSVLGMLTMEYYVGLELIRPIILWFILYPGEEKGSSRAGVRVLRYWLPYVLGMGIFLFWRFVYFYQISPHPEANNPVILSNILTGNQPLSQILHLAQIALQDFLQLNLFAWLNTISPDSILLTSKLTLATWAVGALIAAGLIFLIRRLPVDLNYPGKSSKSFILQGMVLGLLAILFGGLPVWLTDRQAIVGVWSDRFFLAPMFGMAILLVCLLCWFINSENKRSIVLGLLVICAVGGQMRTVDQYRKAFLTQKDAFWQMMWRIPGLKPGTPLLSNQIVSLYTPDYSGTYITNMLYAPEIQSTQLQYLLLSAGRIRGTVVPDFVDHQKITYQARSMTFNGNTSQAVALQMRTPDTCLRVLQEGDQLTPGFQPIIQDLVQISHPDQITREASVDLSLLGDVFLPEPAHTWCYYFEKADLARQYEDWQGVRRLDEEAKANGFATHYGVELLPFIEAYAHLGEWKKAEEYTSLAQEQTEKMEPMLCHFWEQIDQKTAAGSEKEQTLSTVYRNLQCLKE
jgi:hypothetical protein